MSALDNLKYGAGVLPASPVSDGKEIPVNNFKLENGVSISGCQGCVHMYNWIPDSRPKDDPIMVAVMECLKLFTKEEVEAFKDSKDYEHEIVYSPEFQKEFSGGIKLYKAKVLTLAKTDLRYNNHTPHLLKADSMYMLIDRNNNVQAIYTYGGTQTLTHGSETRKYHKFFRLATPTPLKEKFYANLAIPAPLKEKCEGFYANSDLKIANRTTAFGLDLETGKAIAGEKIDDYNRNLKNGEDIVEQIIQTKKQEKALKTRGETLKAEKEIIDAKRKEFETGTGNKTTVTDFIK